MCTIYIQGAAGDRTQLTRNGPPTHAEQRTCKGSSQKQVGKAAMQKGTGGGE